MENQIKQSQQISEEQLNALYVDLKERTDIIVHQSSKDILKLEEEVNFLKAEALKSEREMKVVLKKSQGIRKWLYFFALVSFSLLGLFVLIFKS